MSSAQQPPRGQYPRTGGVDWARFTPLLALAFAVSAGLALFMNWLYQEGQYYVLIVPMLTGAGVGGMVYLAVRKGHCRSRKVAILSGLLAGTVLYLGYFHAGLVSEIGVRNVSRVDLLPLYVKLRMATDEVRDANTDSVTARRQGGKPNSAQPEDTDTEERPMPVRSAVSGKAIMNWVMFLMEFGLVLATATAFGILQSKRAYCERCRAWMDQEVAAFLAGTGPDLAAAFHGGQIEKILEARVVPILQRMPYVAAAVDFCPSAANGKTSCPAYFSIKEIKGGKMQGNTRSGRFDAPAGTLVLDHVELTPAEAAALSPRFPGLGSLAGAAPPMMAAVVPAVTAGVAGPVVFAQVKPAYPGHEGKILTRGNVIVGNVMVLLVLVGVLGGLAGALGGLFLVLPDESPAHQSLSAARIMLGVIAIIAGLGVAIVSIFIGLRNPSMLGNRRLLALTRRMFKARPERWLELENPELIFVEMVPRKNWGRMMLDTADDIGFLLVDKSRREILFEGDRECYRIPGDAIISCEVEAVLSGTNSQVGTTHQMTVIRAQREMGIWEACFTTRWTDWSVNDQKRWWRAKEIQQSVVAIAPAGAPGPASSGGGF